MVNKLLQTVCLGYVVFLACALSFPVSRPFRVAIFTAVFHYLFKKEKGFIKQSSKDKIYS
ncbi:hypothetical protein K450DRAFT_225624 [Umbelopsis ramanniana AG]|uniref:Uncharacterized protein n=1 Tax=Umbelopsis ramanniana AG TaxID=1314678 RepID=A0AAD5EG95_UMBRA|nr:uncharacterized protein K450DRAFT_225624 [Umbelopsis ramanniana AG]KAI8582954.1 hypothetical protein K450DRAFT_225624 [Umbelopsis ramanniana AG]